MDRLPPLRSAFRGTLGVYRSQKPKFRRRHSHGTVDRVDDGTDWVTLIRIPKHAVGDLEAPPRPLRH